MYICGDNKHGQLGVKSNGESRYTFKHPINQDIQIYTVKCSWQNTLIVSSKPCNLHLDDKKVYITGSNMHGQLCQDPSLVHFKDQFVQIQQLAVRSHFQHYTGC